MDEVQFLKLQVQVLNDEAALLNTDEVVQHFPRFANTRFHYLNVVVANLGDGSIALPIKGSQKQLERVLDLFPSLNNTVIDLPFRSTDRGGGLEHSLLQLANTLEFYLVTLYVFKLIMGFVESERTNVCFLLKGLEFELKSFDLAFQIPPKRIGSLDTQLTRLDLLENPVAFGIRIKDATKAFLIPTIGRRQALVTTYEDR